jgi:hypothetical protein
MKICSVAIAGLILGLSIAASRASADDQGNTFQVVPANSVEFGNTYGEWSARWWQWLLAIPEATNPNLTTDTVDCTLGQSGQVYFLAGTFGGPGVMRTCTIPGGKDLFFSPLNGVFGELGPVGTPDGPSDCPGGPNTCDLNKIRKLAAMNVDNPQLLEVTIDGFRVHQLAQNRVTSPVFNAFFPEGAIADIPTGLHGPLVSDGYWVLLNRSLLGPILSISMESPVAVPVARALA